MASSRLSPFTLHFLQRAYDQLVHDVALQNLPVLFAIDRAGLVGGDGPTHAGAYDISFMRCLPNLVIMAPCDENETRQMLYTGFQLNQPVAVRYPRGTGPGVSVEKQMSALPLGKGEIRRSGKKIAFLSFGPMLEACLSVAAELDASVANMRFIKPLDSALILELAAQHDLLVTVDENTVAGGAGSAVNECLAENLCLIPVLNLGLPERPVQHGTRGEMLTDAGLDSDGILAAVQTKLEQQSNSHGALRASSQ